MPRSDGVQIENLGLYRYHKEQNTQCRELRTASCERRTVDRKDRALNAKGNLESNHASEDRGAVL